MPALEIVALDESTPQLRAPGVGDTYLAPRAMEITPPSLTGAAATSSLAIAQTWNTSGTPTALDLNVTDTASNAASLLMNLRVGGASRLSVDKTGLLTLPVSGGNGSGIVFAGSALSASSAYVGQYGFRLRSTGELAWSSGTNLNSSLDTILARDAANTLALRNGTNAQGFNVYNTFTDASNYERLQILFSGNIAYIRTGKAGTGSDRTLVLNASGDTMQTIAIGLNEVTFGRPVVLQQQHVEMREQTAPAAPSADRVRIYAEDNGAGKTRLMARFATGAAQQIAIEP